MEEKNRQKLEDLEEIVVLYHAHCVDGFTGAWVAHKKFGEKASYIPVKRGEDLPEGLEGKEVYVVDFSFSREDYVFAESITKKFVVIDHHSSAEEGISVVKEHLFTIDHSVAYLAYTYFFPGKDVPLFVQYVSEGDIYKITLPKHKELMMPVYAGEKTFEKYDIFEKQFEGEAGRSELLAMAETLSIYKEKILEPVLSSVHFMEFGGVIMPSVNAALPIDEKSEVLQRIYTAFPPVALMYRFDDGVWKCSLRSNDDFDCTSIAIKYGGGGHKGAAGFAIPGDLHFPDASEVKEDALSEELREALALFRK